jgi:hypothetical protein
MNAMRSTSIGASRNAEIMEATQSGYRSSIP